MADLIAGLMVLGLVIYTLTGGADFGGGIVDILARGPRQRELRGFIEKALAPIWEANHVWLIFVAVLLFSSFPSAFSAVSIALHVPLTLMLIGIVIRGATFVFRHYGANTEAERSRYGVLFGVASVATPFCLGVSLAAISEGHIQVSGALVQTDFLSEWTTPFALSVGALTVCVCAYLANVYLAYEARRESALQPHFVRHAQIFWVLTILALIVVGALGARALDVQAHLVAAIAVVAATGAAAATALYCLRRGHWAWARLTAATQVTLVLSGWAALQAPYLIKPSLTIADAAAEPAVLRTIALIAGMGALVLLPSLAWLFRVFKGSMLLWLVASVASAEPPAAAPPRYEVHLLTMGPGEDLYTAGGHAALMVATFDAGSTTPKDTLVYNFGDAYWDDPKLVEKFFAGRLPFFLSMSGTFNDTVNDYGLRQAREIFRQKLNLTDEQAQTVAQRLATMALPANREYVYHHYRAICTTKIRDLLDDVLGGALKAQLGEPSGITVRHFQHVVFTGHALTGLLAEVLMGRLHDQPLDRYAATFIPYVMADTFQKVKLTGPERVLAGDKSVVTESPDEPFVPSETWVTRIVFLLEAVVLVALGLRRPSPRVDGAVLVFLGVTSGVIGSLITGLFIFSELPELRWNENIFLFPPFDLVLVWAGLSVWRGRRVAWLQGYALARGLVVATVLVLHAVGVFYQRPLALLALAVATCGWLWSRGRRRA